MTDSKPSKTERKRRQHALQQLGERLLELSQEQLASLELDERLQDALTDARKMTSHEALRRHKQYIGKLMRNVDAEPIEALFAKLKADDRREKRVFADAERWRDRIVNEGHAALAELEADIGTSLDDVAERVDELERAVSDRAEKTLKRDIFRRIHAALAARTADR
ncbi:MAG: ribosome biogenesis factor YjgA [Woeseiaceae bacterium]|nr:ribosome biogenesis factor YjgA [Woeseiaceae bacterium]